MEPNPSISPLSSYPLLSLVLNSALIRWFIIELTQWWRSSRFHGTYKVEKHDVTLDLLDEQGRIAIYTKRQSVEFLEDGIFAIQDQAWGDGDIFVGYKCSPGIAVDQYKEGFRWKILISLRGTKNKGDKETFVIERTIEDGFTNTVDNFQTLIDHPTTEMTLKVIFPAARIPKHVTLIEQNLKRTHILGVDSTTTLSQGRVQYDWHVVKPRLYESYILRWEW